MKMGTIVYSAIKQQKGARVEEDKFVGRFPEEAGKPLKLWPRRARSHAKVTTNRFYAAKRGLAKLASLGVR